MTYQLLVSTMHRKNLDFIKEMNIHSDAIIINQCDHFGYEAFLENGFKIQMYSFSEKGVGLSRNSALMRSDADIIEFADDDMIFYSSHREDVLREFERHPEADAILFSVESLNPQRPLLKITKFTRVHWWKALKYGCARLAVRRNKIYYNNICFSLLFGGGAKYGSGEDTLFLQDCIRARLKIYCSPIKVAEIKQENSSWFQGYNEKYYHDKGALFAAALPRFCYYYAFFKAMKDISQEYRKSQILQFFIAGIEEYKQMQDV